MSERLQKEILDELNDAWLNINVDNDSLIRPLDILDSDDPEIFYKKLTWLLSNPDYFAFLCKHIFKIDILPFQSLILKELYHRKFPMLIGSRGMGKLLRPNEKIRIKNGWTTMEDIDVGDQVYGSNGELCNVTFKTELQTNVTMYRVTLRDGRSIECCKDHMWKVWDKNKNRKTTTPVWSELTTEQMAEKYFWIRKNSKSKHPQKIKEYRYALPINQPLIDEDGRHLPLHPYVVGVLLGDGSLTTKSIKITSLDKDLLNRFESLLPDGYELSPPWKGKDYTIRRSTKKVVPFYQLCQQVGIYGYNSYTKFIPDEYKFSSYDQKLDLIKGLMDTDGTSSNNNLEYYTVSNRLSNDFIDVIRSLGISCKHTIKESWFNKRRYTDCNRVRIYTNKPIFSIDRKLEYLSHQKSKAAQSKYEKTFITNIERVDDGDGYCISVDSPDHTYITKDYIVTHNTFIMSLYCLLRAFLMPNRKIVVVGAAFRQSKFLHDYMENIWKNSPILRDLCDSNSGPRRDVDMCRMVINGSQVVALPIGDGCVVAPTMTTRENGFANIVDKSDSVWGNNKLRTIEYNIDNGVKPTKIITTKKGFSYEATYNHAMRVLRDGKIEWGRTDQMKIGDRILIDRSERWHDGDFKCTEDEAYMLGAILGDGCWTNKYRMRFATKDQEIIDRINSPLDKKFVQCKDGVHWDRHGISEVVKWLDFWKLQDKCYTKNKTLPETILSAPQEAMTACLQGLMDTDGHVFVDESRGGITSSVNFTNTSKRLVEQIQYILLHYGIVSKVSSRERGEKWNTVYELGIYGKNVKIFAEKIGFYLPRKQNKLLDAVNRKKNWNSFDDDIPLNNKIVAKSIDRSKRVPFKYCESKILSKKSFQQSFLKNLLPYCNTPEWEELLNQDIFYDEVISIEDSESHTYDIHVPEGNEYCANGFFSHNSKIRGQRANDIISDEFASMSREIFENVIAGFAAVSASPSEGVKLQAAKRRAKELNIDPDLLTKNQKIEDVGNQIVLAGTAYYDFNHFATYWKRWKSIIKSKGDPHKLKDVFGEEDIPESFNWKDYSIIRIPVDLIPKGFMDDAQIARSKATVHNGIYLMEFGAVFCTDSAGFFKRSLIESCVGSDQKPVNINSGEVYFDPMLKGNPTGQYIIGVDPASEVDNFSIVVLEVHNDHRRIVHCWTTNRQQHKDRISKGLTEEKDFYSFCARKIRDLMGAFPTVHIAMDAQGGGIAVSEALHDPKNLSKGEVPIWPTIDENKAKDTDDEAGLHILELCQFAKYDWLSEANHGLRKDFEDKVLIFPRFDPITIGLSIEQDKMANRTYDTLEDCVMEIEELKNELCMIEIRQTSTGREHWDTPEVKIGTGRKERIRKDRYSSLLMANMAARQTKARRIQDEYNIVGGFAEMSSKEKRSGLDFIGPAWAAGLNNVY